MQISCNIGLRVDKKSTLLLFYRRTASTSSPSEFNSIHQLCWKYKSITVSILLLHPRDHWGWQGRWWYFDWLASGTVTRIKCENNTYSSYYLRFALLCGSKFASVSFFWESQKYFSIRMCLKIKFIEINVFPQPLKLNETLPNLPWQGLPSRLPLALWLWQPQR